MRKVRYSKIVFYAASLAMFITIFAVSGSGQPFRPGARGGLNDQRPGGGPYAGRTLVLPEKVMAFESLSVILGAPTDDSIAVNVLSGDAKKAYIEYGEASGVYDIRTKTVALPVGAPVEIALSGLKANTRYYYRARYAASGGADFAADAERSFHTQRAPGESFTFEIMGDSHPERLGRQFDESLYVQVLSAAADDQPDFFMTIGDDFSVDELTDINAESVKDIYYNQRLFMSLVGGSAPIFLVNGNHEQSAGYNLDGTPDNVAVWAQTNRNSYFSEPTPDGFYTGNEDQVEYIGLLRNYYAWTWGDALFVVIDPYWYSQGMNAKLSGGGPMGRDKWKLTLGEEQYQWFMNTLEDSDAKYKFVFAHHVLGFDRGGVECANLFEWGGYNLRGVYEFGDERPGWEAPIHKLMVKNGVTIFFQGHDHLFAKQELDGVIYQTLPSPADPNYDFVLNHASAYQNGDLLPDSGRVRVTVAESGVKVEYVRSYLPKDETRERKDGEIAYEYTVTK